MALSPFSSILSQPTLKPLAQERLGWHTFRQGDKVQYTLKQKKEGGVGLAEGESFEAVVFGVLYHEDKPPQQGRKYFVLYDMDADTFFVDYWTHYRRLPKYPDSITFNVDGVEVKTLSVDEVSAMVAAFDKSIELAHLTLDKDVKEAAEKGPPRLKIARDQKKAVQKRLQADAARKERKEKKDAEKKVRLRVDG